jgi:HK97 family phage major capsid protein
MKNLKELREERQEHAIAARQIYNAAYSATRDMSVDEVQQFESHYKRAVELDRECQLAELERQEVSALSELRYAGAKRFPMITNSSAGRFGEPNQQFSAYSRVAKLKAFKDETLAYAAGQFLRAVVSREFNHAVDRAAEDYCSRLGWQVTNAGSEGVGSGGGFLVPSPLSAVILDVREEVGVARRAFNIQPMSSDSLAFPKHASGLTVYYPGELQSLPLSDVTWAQIELLAKKRSVASQLSQELVDDAIVNIVDYIFREMAYALADREDAEAIDGDGGAGYGQVVGLKNAIGAGGIHTCSSGHDTWPEIDLADVMSWIALLPDRYHSRQPKIICSAAFYHSVLLRLAVQAGGNTLASLMGGDGGRRNFLGYEVLTTPYMPTSSTAATVAAFFGAFDAGALLAERTGIRLARSDDYSFLNHCVTLRATTRYDIEIHDAGTASAPGAYVALKTSS